MITHDSIEWIITIHHRRLWITSLVGALLQALLRLRHRVWRRTLLVLRVLRWRYKTRIALTWRIGHDAAEQIARPMADCGRCRVGNSTVGR